MNNILHTEDEHTFGVSSSGGSSSSQTHQGLLRSSDSKRRNSSVLPSLALFFVFALCGVALSGCSTGAVVSSLSGESSATQSAFPSSEADGQSLDQSTSSSESSESPESQPGSGATSQAPEPVFVGSQSPGKAGQLTSSESADANRDLAVPVESALAVDLLNRLVVASSKSGTNPVGASAYQRNQFGPAWADIDRNGCDTRNDILRRDLTDVSFKSRTHNCVVASGTLSDPYTGAVIHFVRGQSTSTAVQIDHVVALANAWQSGAWKLPYAARVALANDPLNLLAVDGPTNQQKSSSDAAAWLPSQASFRCNYVARQIAVKTKYQLTVTPSEKTAMTSTLLSCPGEMTPSQ